MSEDVNQKIVRSGALVGMVGSLLAMVGNLLHPATPLDDPVGVARLIAESETWFPVHFAIVIGLILMFGGLVALYHTLRAGPSAEFARFGFIAAMIGATVGLVVVILDGVAAKQLAEEWATAPSDERAAALRIVLANETLNFALASLFNLVFAGVTFILFGLAVAKSDIYPRWLGGIVVAAGISSLGAGLIQGLTGEPTVTSRVLTILGPTVITLWVFAMCILMTRQKSPMDASASPRSSPQSLREQNR